MISVQKKSDPTKKNRGRWRWAGAGVLLLAGLWSALIGYNNFAGQSNRRTDSLRQALVSFDENARPAPVLAEYLRDNQIASGRFDSMRLGVFASGPYQLAGYLFRPDGASRGTVVFLHGYLLNTVCHDRFFDFLLGQGYAVAAFDLPGHGLSSGQRGGIESFEQYSQALADFMARLRPMQPGPYHVVAHSTGCSALLQYLLENREDPFGTVTLIAPLVHNVLWRTSRLGMTLADPFTEWVPRVWRASSSDLDYLVRQRSDPLAIRHLPLGWNRALLRWNQSLATQPPCARPVLIIQGDCDTVVDWRYNLPVLQTLLPGCKIDMIAGGRHDLLNESDALRLETFDRIISQIEEKQQVLAK